MKFRHLSRLISKVLNLSGGWAILLRVALSGALLFFVARTVDFGDWFTTLSSSNLSLILVALVVAILDRVLMAYKWNILLKAKQINISLISATYVYMASTFLGIFLPATVGADSVRGYAFYRSGHNMSDLISSIVIERVLGLFALALVAVLGIGISAFVLGYGFLLTIGNLLILVAVIFLSLLVIVRISFSKNLVSNFESKVIRKFQGENTSSRLGKFANKLQSVISSYSEYKDQKRVLSAFLLLSILENMFPIIWTYLLALAFGIDVPFAFFFILMPIVLVLVRIPISLDGFGIQEGAFVFILSMVGVAAPEALLLGLASHFVAILSVLPGGVIYTFKGFNQKISIDGIESQNAQVEKLA